MKLVLIYRNRVVGANSIEEIFHSLAPELSKSLEVVEYQLGSRKLIISDILNLRRLKADIYHVTGDVHYMICFLPHAKSVLTIHDIYHYMNKLTGLKKIIYKWLWLILPIRCAKFVTTISIETKDMLQNVLNLKNKPIYVIYNCYNNNVFKPSMKEFSSVNPIILHIGCKPNKNLPKLIEAIRGLQCTLYIIGHLNHHLSQLLQKNKINYQNFVNLTHEEVYEKYVQADIVAFVSLFEGFGMPILEAQAVGRVVITSNIEPMISVSGGGACLVNPVSETSISSGIKQVIINSEYRNQLINRGFANVDNYSNTSIARQYYDLYQNV